jgi:hypothetical protein
MKSLIEKIDWEVYQQIRRQTDNQVGCKVWPCWRQLGKQVCQQVCQQDGQRVDEKLN